jgi:hypothetical protein
MAAALGHPCAAQPCAGITTTRFCPAHQTAPVVAPGKQEKTSARGYGWKWQQFRGTFLRLLVSRDVVPVCGASLPEGPQTRHSRCKGDGVQTFQRLHLDHEPPLTPEERSDVRTVCNPLRIQLLCAACHAAKGKG